MRKGWKETTLGEVAKCAGGSSFPIEHQNGRTGIPFIKVSDLNTPGNDREITSALNYITSELAAELGVRVWPIDTVVFPKVGAALLTDKRRILTQDTIFDNNLLGLVGNHEIYPRFLLLFMETIRMSDFAQMGALPSVSHGIIEKLCILLPPLTEQRRIVDVIGSVDAYVASLESYATAARTARAALLHELLTTNTQGWKETTLGEVAEVNPKELRLADDAPFIPMDAVKVGKRRVEYTEPRGSRSGARADSGDVLFARITPCLENGKVAQIQDEIGRCGGSTEFIVIRATTVLDPALLYLWATWERTRGTAAQLMTGTTGRQRLAALDLSRLEFLLPPLTEQKRIVDVIGSVDGAIAGADRAAEDARNLRSGLLSDLLSGDHEIPEGYDELLGAA